VHELSTNTGGHLQLIEIQAWDLPDMKGGLGKGIMEAMTYVSRNHPQVKLSADFWRTPFTPEDVEALAEALPIAKLRILAVAECGINAAGTARIAESLKHAPGCVVDMCDNEFNSEGVGHLAAALPALNALVLKDANFGQEDRANLDAVPKSHGKAISWS